MADNKMKLELVLVGKDSLAKILSKDIGLLKEFKKEAESAADSTGKKRKLSLSDAGVKSKRGVAPSYLRLTGDAALHTPTGKASEESRKPVEHADFTHEAGREAAALQKVSTQAVETARSIENLSQAKKHEPRLNLTSDAADAAKLSTNTNKAAQSQEKLNSAVKGKPKLNLKSDAADAAKLSDGTGKAAQSQAKLNNEIKSEPKSHLKQDAESAKQFAGDTNKAAAAQEKLNQAIKREPKPKRGSSDGGRRGSRRRYVSDSGDDKPPRGGGRYGSLTDDLLQGGTGLTLNYASKEGIKAAMSQQEALTDLRSAIQRTGDDAAKTDSQMNELNRQATEYGNKLPGNTVTFLNLAATLKKRGIDTDTIAGGAFKAASYLAVANKEDPENVGVNLSSLGQMYQLKGADYPKAANLMSQIYSSHQISTEELAEAQKYFAGRAAVPLGLKGLQGLQDSTRFLAFIRQKSGMESSMVGEESASFSLQFVKAMGGRKRTQPLADIKKQTGVDLQLFDKKGSFLGLENMVNQFAKLKGKLTDVQMIDFGQKLAGNVGTAVMTTMIKHGDEWKGFNEDANRTVDMMAKADANAGNFSMKIEALTGSLENLGAAGFTPLLQPLGKLTDKTNEVVGSLTEMAKTHPVEAGTISSIIALGGAFLTLKSGAGLISRFLNTSRGEIASVGGVAQEAEKKVGGFKSSLGGLAGTVAVTLVVTEVASKLSEFEGQGENKEAGYKASTENYNEFENRKKLLAAKGEKPSDAEYSAQAGAAWQSSLNLGLKESLPSDVINRKFLSINNFWESMVGKATDDALSNIVDTTHLWRYAFNSKNDFKGWTGGGASEGFKQSAPQLADANVMASFLEQLPQRIKDPSEQETVRAGVKEANPLSYDRGMDILREKSRQQYPQIDQSLQFGTQFRDPKLTTGEMFRQILGLNNAAPGANNANASNPIQQNLLDLATPTNALNQSFTSLNGQILPLGESFFNLQQPSNGLTEQFLNLNTNSGTAVTGVNNLATATNDAASRIRNLQIDPPTFAPIQVPVYQNTANPGVPPPVSIPGRAKGGSVAAGKPYFVGEIGKELFIPETSGKIIPNDRLRSQQKTFFNSNTGLSLKTVNSSKNFAYNQNNILGRAKGGSVAAGKPYFVGEIGKELFIPETNGSIVPNDYLRSQQKTITNSHTTLSLKTINSTGNFAHSEGNIPGRAKGGSVTKGHTYRINEIGQEFFTPSVSGSVVSNNILRNIERESATIDNRKLQISQVGQEFSEGGTSENYVSSVRQNNANAAAIAPIINFTVPISITGADNPRETAREIKQELEALVSEIKQDFSPRNVARKVAYEAERDSERT